MPGVDPSVLSKRVRFVSTEPAVCCEPSSSQPDSMDRWPSGLRRQLKVISSGCVSESLVRKGVGSNPTLFNMFLLFVMISC
jgi:hypothetical protein